MTKNNAFILFVDNEHFPVVDNLIAAGWAVKRVRDIKNPQDDDVKRASIIFVDYKGVGRSLSEEDEGVGVIKILKELYKKSKRIILYSAYGRFTLGPHLNVADNQMSKESNTYEFIEMIESELRKIK